MTRVGDEGGTVTKVLYIEHDDDNLYMLKMRLERVGDFEVLTTEDSETGWKLAATEPLDVILTREDHDEGSDGPEWAIRGRASSLSRRASGLSHRRAPPLRRVQVAERSNQPDHY